jgi:hypothetical protein
MSNLKHKPETLLFITAVEKHADRKFRFHEEIAILVDLSSEISRREIFNELIFLAKFITNASSVLRRMGADSSDTAKLSAEFQKNLEKSVLLIGRIIEGTPNEIANMFKARFLPLKKESMDELIALINELSRIKNYELDTEKQN